MLYLHDPFHYPGFRRILMNFLLNNVYLQYLADPLSAQRRKLAIQGIDRASERILFR